jgi:hypothetical protein
LETRAIHGIFPDRYSFSPQYSEQRFADERGPGFTNHCGRNLGVKLGAVTDQTSLSPKSMWTGPSGG